MIWTSLVLLFRWRTLAPSTKQTAIGWTAVLLLGTWLITPSSILAWDYLPLLKFTLYPWRMLGIISLATAVLAGLSAQHSHLTLPPTLLNRLPILYKLAPRQIGQLPLILFAALLTLTTVPWLYPSTEPTPERLTQYDISRAEVPPFLVGTTTLGEFLPIDVTELPDTTALQTELTTTAEPDRLLPQDGVAVTWENGNPMNAHYTLTAEQATTLTYRQFYFPGWRATLNGRDLPLTPSQTHGLITFDLPAGTHVLTLTFGSTPIRTAANVTSLIALLILVTLFLLARQNKTDTQAISYTSRAQVNPAPLTLSLVVVWLFIFTAVIDTPLRRDTLQPDHIIGTPQRQPLDYAADLRLVTYEQSAAQIVADDPLTLTLYWQPLRKIHVDYVAGIQIIDDQGQVWHAGDPQRPSDWRFVAGDEPWPLNSYRLDPFILTLLDGAPPGAYQWRVGLVNRATSETIQAHDMGEILVTAPANGQKPFASNMTPHGETAAGLTLLGSTLDRTTARPGDPMRVAALWQVTQANQATNHFTLQLVDQDNTVLWDEERTIAPHYPLEKWQTADRLRSDQVFRLPASLPTGTHTWQTTWGNQTVSLGEIDITAPERTFTPPPVDLEIGQTLGDIATLQGATLDSAELEPTAALELDLIWQATAETDISYRVFVHLIGPDGTLVAQADGEPAAWTRPTTGWLPPEIIIDSHTLPLPGELPDGEYTLLTGLYDPATGQRLATGDDQDVITIIKLMR